MNLRKIARSKSNGSHFYGATGYPVLLSNSRTSSSCSANSSVRFCARKLHLANGIPLLDGNDESDSRNLEASSLGAVVRCYQAFLRILRVGIHYHHARVCGLFETRCRTIDYAERHLCYGFKFFLLPMNRPRFPQWPSWQFITKAFMPHRAA